MTVSESPFTITQETRVLGQMRAWLANGDWVPGQRIPAERNLAETLNVNRKAIRAGLATLERDGLIKATSPRIRIVTSNDTILADSLYFSVLVLTNSAKTKEEAVSAPHEHDGSALLGILDGIQEMDLTPMTMDPGRLHPKMIQRMVARRPRGVIVLQDAIGDDHGARAVEALVGAGIPVVAYADTRSPASLREAKYDRVRSDQRAGAKQLTQYLIKRGCRRILRLWSINPDNDPEWKVERDAGVLEALEEASLPVLPGMDLIDVKVGPLSENSFRRLSRATAGFLIEALTGDNPVDAILALSDHVYYYAAAACRIFGKKPQEDVLIAGYDNTWSTYLERRWEPSAPAVTVNRDMPLLGKALVEMLNKRIQGSLPPEPQTQTVEPRLVVLDQ